MEALLDVEPEAKQPLEENARVKSLKAKARYGFDANGKAVSKAKAYSYRDAIFEGRASRTASPDRPDAGRVGRGELRLGRRVRRLQRPDRAPAVPPPVQLAHLRGGHHRRRRRSRSRAAAPSSS